MPYQVISYKSIHDWKKAVYYKNGIVYGSTFQRMLDDDEVRGYQLSYVEAEKSLNHLFADVVVKYSPDGSLMMTKLASLSEQAWKIVQKWLDEQDIAKYEASVYLPDLSKMIEWEEIGERPDFYVYDPVTIEIKIATPNSAPDNP